ncbi:alkaline phosphatase D family protein [Nitrosospira sp. Nsp13]|uniref:alkaline phosphatase D family protein n=1 Tax=Nitrosospira sp. Nsp13 TaxID=1855332 RepID=UPI000887F70B|nr:alkaline phosphatase D family protein [Nitrosospira sp. Nsp13]SCX84741.1 alkaline phosphatase D [Nitrosospira sp. Nsp13]
MKTFHFYDRGSDRPWINPMLTNAVIVGHTTATSTKLWLRAYQENSYRMVICPEPLLGNDEVATDWNPETTVRQGKEVFSLKNIHSGDTRVIANAVLTDQANLEFKHDITNVWEIDGLKPGQRYYYAAFALNPDLGGRKTPWEIVPDNKVNRFKTQNNSQESMTFGLFSCHMPYKKNSFDLVNIHMWDRFGDELEQRNGEFILGVGDQVYVDGNSNVSIWEWLKKIRKEFIQEVKPEDRVEVMRSWYRDIYRGYWGHRQLRNVFSRFPTYMMWDDHEILDGWGSYNAREKKNLLDSWWDWGDDDEKLLLLNQMYEAAKLTYDEYEHSHNPSTPPDQFDYPFTWGTSAFYVLDMRGQRDYTRKTNDRILGRAQMQRFKDWLGSDTVKNAESIFVVSPVPVVHARSFAVNYLDILNVADDMRDEWEHDSNWVERDVLLDAVFAAAKANDKSLYLLSGDVHIGAAFRMTHKQYPDTRVYQLTSSAITYDLPWAKASALALVVNDHGLLQRDKEHSEPNVAFQLLMEPCKTNNFALINVQRNDQGKTEVHWDLYGSAEERATVTKLERLVLT